MLSVENFKKELRLQGITDVFNCRFISSIELCKVRHSYLTSLEADLVQSTNLSSVFVLLRRHL